jgi:hypothetical protein
VGGETATHSEPGPFPETGAGLALRIMIAMFALAAVISFALALIFKFTDTSTGALDLVILGLLFVALHLLVGLWVPFGPRK